jgi:hypothetical protein
MRGVLLKRAVGTAETGLAPILVKRGRDAGDRDGHREERDGYSEHAPESESREFHGLPVDPKRIVASIGAARIAARSSEGNSAVAAVGRIEERYGYQFSVRPRMSVNTTQTDGYVTHSRLCRKARRIVGGMSQSMTTTTGKICGENRVHPRDRDLRVGAGEEEHDDDEGHREINDRTPSQYVRGRGWFGSPEGGDRSGLLASGVGSWSPTAVPALHRSGYLADSCLAA